MTGSAFAGATGTPVQLDIAAIFGARNHYAVLGVAHSADAREIRHAYRQVSLRIHPDKVQSFLKEDSPQLVKDAEAAFKLVSAAYEILCDDGKRAGYNQTIGLAKGKGQKARTQPQHQDPSKKPEPWVYRAPKKEEEPAPEARESIDLTVRHAIYGHEVRVTVGKGVAAALVKKTLSRMLKRGPPDRIELATAEGAPIDGDYVFSGPEHIFSVGLSLGPPRRVNVAITDTRTGVCRSIAVLDTSSMLQVAREVAKAAGADASDVEVGHFLFTEEGLTEFERLEERELLNGRRRLAVQGKTSGLFFITLSEAAAMQDDLIASYSREDVQRKLDELIARQTHGEPMSVTEFHKALGEVVENSRKDVVTKWGFEGDMGFVQMCRGIHRYEAAEEIHTRSIEIGKLLRGMSREAAYIDWGRGDDGNRVVPAPMRNDVLSGEAAGGNATSPSAAHGKQQADVLQPVPAQGDGLEAGLVLPAAEAADIPHGNMQIWRICGGKDKGGILAREGLDLESPFCAERLSTGAFVRELALVYVEAAGERLHFQRLTGSGPETGWISVALPHKNLAERMWMTAEEAVMLARTGSCPGQNQFPYDAPG